MDKDLSKGKQLLKTAYYRYCINQRIKKKYNAWSSLRTPCKCIVYPSACLTEPSPTFSQFKPSQSPISLCCSLGKLPLFFRNFTQRNYAISLGQYLTTCTTYTPRNMLQMIVQCLGISISTR